MSVRRKYGNVPTETDGIRFASKREAERWATLRLKERLGEIRHLARQIRYPLVVAGQPIAVYVADFVYELPDGRQVVEDAKGFRLREYVLKRRLMLACHGIEIQEV